MLKLLKTAQNYKTQEVQKVPKKCYNKQHEKVPKSTKRCQKDSYLSLYETTMSYTCHIFGKPDYNGGSPV